MNQTYNVPPGYKLLTDGDYERFKKAAAVLKELSLYLPDEWIQQPQKAKEFFAKLDEKEKETEKLRKAFQEREQQYQQLVLQNRIREFSEKYNVDPLFIDKEKFASLKEESEIEQFAQEALQKQQQFLAKFGVQVNPQNTDQQPGVMPQMPQQTGNEPAPNVPPTPPGLGASPGVPVAVPDITNVMDSVFGAELKLGGK